MRSFASGTHNGPNSCTTASNISRAFLISPERTVKRMGGFCQAMPLGVYQNRRPTSRSSFFAPEAPLFLTDAPCFSREVRCAPESPFFITDAPCFLREVRCAPEAPFFLTDAPCLPQEVRCEPELPFPRFSTRAFAIAARLNASGPRKAFEARATAKRGGGRGNSYSYSYSPSCCYRYDYYYCYDCYYYYLPNWTQHRATPAGSHSYY